MSRQPLSDDLTATFGEVVYAYTRAEAIADGVLVDVTELARAAGFRHPVAMTSAAWSDCVAWTREDSDRQVHQDQTGRGVANRTILSEFGIGRVVYSNPYTVLLFKFPSLLAIL